VSDSVNVFYASADDGAHLGYQVLGDGVPKIVSCGYGTMVSIDMRDEEPHIRAFEDRLTQLGGLLRFDPRGIGLSDPVVPGAALTTQDLVRDLIAVLDHAGVDRAALIGVGTGSAPALATAADHPDRVSSLILHNGSPRLARAPDYPFGIPPKLIDAFLDNVLDTQDQAAAPGDDIRMLAASLADDPAYRAWWAKAGRRGASPSSARAIMSCMFAADTRDLLPTIACPTLVLHRVDTRFLSVEHARYLAAHIPSSHLVELAGRDHMPYAGDAEAVLGEIEEFLTGARSSGGGHRVLATILFTDIVGSTQQATRLGDGPWRELLDVHDQLVRAELARRNGREIKTTGDGILATFAGPAQGMQCARAIIDGARALGLEIRAGVHTGEVEMRGADVSGVGVHIAQRVSSAAGPGEILVSRTVVDLVTGSGIRFHDRGEHELKGVPGPWLLFAVDPASLR
jgi:class 3 adenylate cyclase